jgi:peptidoglycan/LPS O-acetylase OafA/YrhL
MTHAFDDRPLGDVHAESSAAAEDSAAARGEQMLAGPGVLAPKLAWTPVVIPGLAEGDRKVTENRAKRPSGTGRALPRRRLRGLDGLRAIAVLSVVVFHLDFSLAPGGFLGVDVFFVISGFLITNLLATEILTTGRLRLGQFYLRRARRLLPTVLALLALVTIASTTIWRDQLATLKGGVISSLTYVTNWWLIADHQPYFVSTGRPSMVQHLWSLAIEEQYYIVWSLVMVIVAGAVLAWRRGADSPVTDSRRRLQAIVVIAGVLAAASTVAMTIFAVRQNLPYGASTSRVYFGSDTHSMGLFLGSAAGAWIALRHHRRPAASIPSARAPFVRATDLVGTVAVGVVVYQFFAITEFTPGLYRGGFLAFDAAVLVAIVCATRRGSLFGRVLDIRPLRWVGQRSYSIYIWHWPVCVVTRPDLDVHGPAFLINTIRLALILALSALSYRFVEGPLRRGQFTKWRRERKTRASRIGEMIAILTALISAAILLLTAGPVDATQAPPIHAVVAPHSSGPVRSAPPDRDHSQSPGVQPPPVKGSATTAPVQPAGKPALSAFGDSVLLGAGPALTARTRHLDLDAVEGRQADDVLDDVTRDAHKGTLAPDVLIHVGDNGIISPDQLNSTLHALSGASRVVLMTVRVPREWQDPNNSIIRSVGKRFDNVTVVDWHGEAGHSHKWLYPDGLHLTTTGAVAYARIVLAALK